MNKKISIILPVYNVEKYIYKCLNSIRNQKYKNYEVIIIDDGSSDKSRKICDDFCMCNKKFTVYHYENKGVSTARNIGLDKVTGEYVFFIDSDDYIEEDYFEFFMNNIENYGLISCGYLNNCDENKKIINSKDKKNVIFEMFDNSNFGGYLWNKIYNVNVIKSNNLKFNEQLTICEDMEFNIRYINVINVDTMISNKKLYNYISRDNSAIKQIGVKKFKILNSYKEILNNVDSGEKYYDKILFEYIKILYEMKDYSLNLDKYNFKEISKEINKYKFKINIFNINNVDKLKYFIMIINYKIYKLIKEKKNEKK